MKLVLSISLLILILCSCSNSDCDCSYEAFNKLANGMNIKQVEKILKLKPSKVANYGRFTCYSFACKNNTINALFSSNSLEEHTFNTDLRRGTHVIKRE